MTLKQTKQRGFTIVELLIVVVIIAILAAITIVAYNGIQNRAKLSAAAAAAATIQKKMEAYAIDGSSAGTYPTTLAALTGAASSTSYYVAPGTVTLATAAPTSSADQKTIAIQTCNSAKGYKISYWDFVGGSAAITITGGDTSTGTCTYAAT